MDEQSQPVQPPVDPALPEREPVPEVEQTPEVDQPKYDGGEIPAASPERVEQTEQETGRTAEEEEQQRVEREREAAGLPAEEPRAPETVPPSPPPAAN
jgi:hypothetical protein